MNLKLIKLFLGKIKLFIRHLDEKFNNRRLTNVYSTKLASRDREQFDMLFENGMWINYHQIPNPISSLCDQYGSDKGSLRPFDASETWATHNYADFYHHLFNRFRYSVKNVFECGIGSVNPSIPFHFKLDGIPGASLRVWREYFPNANIYGADIDPSALFNENRIKTFLLDQTSPDSCNNLFSQFNDDFFDIIIDDGLHEFSAGKNLFLCSIDKLNSNGWYIIEDVLPSDLTHYEAFFKTLPFQTHFISMKRDKTGIKSVGSNSLVLIEKISH